MKKLGLSILIYGMAMSALADAPSTILVQPEIARSIEGHGTLNRNRYFGICDQGSAFKKRCKSDERYHFLINELNISFGRKLSLVKYGKKPEDPNHPGYADTRLLKEQLKPRPSQRSFIEDMDGRIEVALHGAHNSYPTYMGKTQTKSSDTEFFPKNHQASAELAATVLRYSYTDFDRPKWFEPVNEPHWSFTGRQDFADWHTTMKTEVQKLNPEVQVGGPCLPVCYFFGKEYKSFNGLRQFIESTGGELDFYSFHCYDYLGSGAGNINGGSINSGAPLESVLDLISNYTCNQLGEPVQLVVSEHGGYDKDDRFAQRMANTHFPELTGFDWELKKRAISNFYSNSSVIANTLVFMNHPHIVQKAVPFILLESMGWDPKYYATLYMPRNYRDKNDWVLSENVNFYQLFRDLKGQRVYFHTDNPDIQVQAFVEGRTLRIVVNNLLETPQDLNFLMPASPSLSIRRLGRNDTTHIPYLIEESITNRNSVTINARETILLTATHPKDITFSAHIDEKNFHATETIKKIEDGDAAEFNIEIPNADQIAYATLRIGISRKRSLGKEITADLNGQSLKLETEISASRNGSDKQGYATCRTIRLKPSWLKPQNTIKVGFADGKPGSVGSVIIRAGSLSR